MVFTARTYICRRCGHRYRFRDEDGKIVLTPSLIDALLARGVRTRCPKCFPDEVRRQAKVKKTLVCVETVIAGCDELNQERDELVALFDMDQEQAEDLYDWLFSHE